MQIKTFIISIKIKPINYYNKLLQRKVNKNRLCGGTRTEFGTYYTPDLLA